MSDYVGGNKLIKNVELVTTSANIAAKTLMLASGAIATVHAAVYGVCKTDTPSGDIAECMTTGILAVIASGGVTAGANVMAGSISGGVTGNINGTATSITSVGVQDQSAAYVRIGRAITGGTTGDTVLVEFNGIQY